MGKRNKLPKSNEGRIVTISIILSLLTALINLITALIKLLEK